MDAASAKCVITWKVQLLSQRAMGPWRLDRCSLYLYGVLVDHYKNRHHKDICFMVMWARCCCNDSCALIALSDSFLEMDTGKSGANPLRIKSYDDIFISRKVQTDVLPSCIWCLSVIELAQAIWKEHLYGLFSHMSKSPDRCNSFGKTVWYYSLQKHCLEGTMICPNSPPCGECPGLAQGLQYYIMN